MSFPHTENPPNQACQFAPKVRDSPTPAHEAEANALNAGMAGAGVKATAGDVNLQAELPFRLLGGIFYWHLTPDPRGGKGQGFGLLCPT